MNILFIHASNIVEPAASGIIRVTATLKRIFEEHGHKCHNAYYKAPPTIGKPVFDDSMKLTPETEVELLSKAFNEWDIDVVINQTHPSKESIHLMQSIRSCKALKKRPMVIQCMHNNPYIEVLGYTPQYMWYILKYSEFSLQQRLKKVLWGIFCRYMPVTSRRKIAARYQQLFDMTDRVVLLSDKFMPELLQYQQFKENQLHYANNPMTYDGAFRQSGLETKEKLVVFIGRLAENQKRLSVSLNIWKRIEKDPRFDDWRFDIVGTGQDEKYHKLIAKKLKLKRVTFCGEQDPKEWYRKASVLMLTSAYEGWGMVINEAQQKGVVPVAFDSYASIRDLINDGEDGCIIPNLDLQAFTETMKKLMSDDKLRRELQLNGLKNSGRYTEDLIYSQWEKVLQ